MSDDWQSVRLSAARQERERCMAIVEACIVAGRPDRAADLMRSPGITAKDVPSMFTEGSPATSHGQPRAVESFDQMAREMWSAVKQERVAAG